MKIHHVLCLLFCSFCCHALDTYTDFEPEYNTNSAYYQIDKIVYEAQFTIIHFRFIVNKNQIYSFNSLNRKDQWVLRFEKESMRQFLDLIQLDSLLINGEKPEELKNSKIKLKRGDQVSMSLYFKKIPSEVSQFDLLEARTKIDLPGKMNCFQIIKKTAQDDLGNEALNLLRIQKFDDLFSYYSSKNTDAKIENSKDQNSLNKQESHFDTHSNDVPEPIDYEPIKIQTFKEIKCGDRMILSDLVFMDEQVKFLNRSRAIGALQSVSAQLKAFSGARLLLHGHTDIFGNQQKNLELSKARAERVKKELVKMGINAMRIAVYYYGGQRPLKQYKKGGSLNRRVEIQFICQD